VQILLWNRGILYKGVARITEVYRFSKMSELLRSRGWKKLDYIDLI
jgi:hypothetical protein